MPDEPEHPTDAVQADGAGLPRDVQEHLGRRLRAALEVEAEKPAFLGDSNLPPRFEHLVRKLEAAETSERQAYEAVRRALEEPGRPDTDPARRGG